MSTVRPKQRKGRFWPGFSWRVLAHKRTKIGKATTGSYVNHPVELSSNDFGVPVEFDELVIDHWFHLEQMSDRHWWIGLGSHDEGGEFWHINVSIDANGKPTISMERD